MSEPYGGTFDEIIGETDQERQAREGEPLPYVDLAADLKPRPWLIPERIPRRNVTLLSGEGAIGKSTLLMQLLGATVLTGGQWLGTYPAHGPALYVTAEEEDNEARLRLEAVAESLGTSRYRLKENGLRVLSFAGRDAVLGEPDRNGIIRPTRLFTRIREDALRLKPKLIGIDAAADVFAGNEINRAQTRQFITMLRGLAMDTDSAVTLVAHPSLQGITSDSGLSGNTAWHNSVRARMYFKKAPGDDKSLRVLEVKKNNYGPEQENIVLRWRDGIYVVEPGAGTLKKLADEANVNAMFLALLHRHTEQGRNVTDKKGTSYAPAIFADEPEAKESKTTSRDLAAAMTRLFAAKKIKVVTEGRASKQRSRIVETEGQEATVIPFPSGAQQAAHQAPTTRPPTDHQEGSLSPPIPPTDGGRGKMGAGLVGAPPRPPSKEGEETDAAAVASIPFMITRGIREQLHQCGLTDDEIAELTPRQAHEIIRERLPKADYSGEEPQ